MEASEPPETALKFYSKLLEADPTCTVRDFNTFYAIS